MSRPPVLGVLTHMHATTAATASAFRAAGERRAKVTAGRISTVAALAGKVRGQGHCGQQEAAVMAWTACSVDSV